MSFYASGPKPAFESRYQSPSQAPAVEKIPDRVSYWRANGRSYTYEPSFDDAKTILEGIVKDANFIPPVGDDRRAIGDHCVEGPEWRQLISPYSSTPYPTCPAWASLKVRQKGPQSLSGIRNRDTISKDSTGGYETRMDDLLASSGKKAMGIKHPRDKISKDKTKGDEARMDDLQATFAKKAMGIKHQAPSWIHIAGPGFKQKDGRLYRISQSSEHRPEVLFTNTGDSCIHYPCDCENDMLNNNLLLVKEDYNGQGGNNSFVIPNMDRNTWISPSIIPLPKIYMEDGIPKQFNGFEIRIKKRKNNIRGRHRK